MPKYTLCSLETNTTTWYEATTEDHITYHLTFLSIHSMFYWKTAPEKITLIKEGKKWKSDYDENPALIANLIESLKDQVKNT